MPIHITYDELNVLTLVMFAMCVCGVWFLHRNFREWIRVQIRDFRIEIQRSMIGTIATREEMKETRDRLLAVGARVDYIESLVSAHIGGCNGASEAGSDP